MVDVNLGQPGEAARAKIIKKGGKISLIGQDGIGGQAAFQGEVLEELVEKRLGKKETLRRMEGLKTAAEAGPGRSVGDYRQVFLVCCSSIQRGRAAC